jgi:hypothetical protein
MGRMMARKKFGMNGGYDLHPQSGRWVQSGYELKVAHYLWKRHIPFFSGIDPPCKVNDGTGRSDDFVIPPRPGLDEIEHRLEIAGMSEYNKDGRATKYNESKQEVHDHFKDDETVDHRIIPKPRNGTAYTQAELSAHLSHIVGGTPEMVHNHNLTNPPLRPGSTYETSQAMLDDICERFEPGTVISVGLIQDTFGTSFWHKLWEFFPEQTMHAVVKGAGMKSELAPYNETKEQFLGRVRDLVKEYGGLLPTSHEFTKKGAKNKWITVQYLRHFDSWGEMLEALGLPANRTTNSLNENQVMEDLVYVRKKIGKGHITSADLQRAKRVDEKTRKLAFARYVWLKNNCKKAGHANSMAYARVLLARADAN